MKSPFGDYLFALLFAPLKRGRAAVNQFWIFLQVVGRQFDEVKTAFFRVREESAVLTCSEEMLPVHGQDRDMDRLRGEILDNYRIRLAMKGIIAAKAGTNEGIRYLAQSFGYETVEIEKLSDPERWAEAIVQFIGGRIVMDDRDILLQELNKIKPARTLLTIQKEQRYQAALFHGTARITARQITFYQE